MKKFLDEFGVARMWQNIKDYIQENSGSSASVPSGFIGIWSGSSGNIPSGWQLCDGTNGTPDLRDKFVLGAGTNHIVGATGGEETHKLTINEMPSHTHFVSYGEKTGSQYRVPLAQMTTSLAASTYKTDTSGGNQEHNNMPPYYALCYIMKI